jgi:hypothetical protein
VGNGKKYTRICRWNSISEKRREKSQKLEASDVGITFIFRSSEKSRFILGRTLGE